MRNKKCIKKPLKKESVKKTLKREGKIEHKSGQRIKPEKIKPKVIDLPVNDIEKEKMVYACIICEQMFKEPGYCPQCNVLLKKKAG